MAGAGPNTVPKVQNRYTNWRAIVQSADPDWQFDANIVPEYEFSGNAKEGGPRLFFGDYRKRGAYAPEE